MRRNGLLVKKERIVANDDIVDNSAVTHCTRNFIPRLKMMNSRHFNGVRGVDWLPILWFLKCKKV